MATEESVIEQFQFLGVELKESVLKKCVKLCELYSIDAEAFVEQWMAFSLSNLKGAAPSVEHLEQLERKEFSKRAIEVASVACKETSTQNAGSCLTIYEPDKSNTYHNLVVLVKSLRVNKWFSYIGSPETDVLTNYMTTTPKRVKTEDTLQNNASEHKSATFSPTCTHSAKYASRTNAGTVVHSYGEEDLLKELSKPNDINNILNVSITQVPNDDGEVYTKAMFGFELLHEKASAFDNHIQYLAQCILKKHGLGEASSVRLKSQAETVVCGRVECDADARLHAKCVVLQGTWADSLSQSVPVDLDNVASYSLFPGQVVALRGVNPRGDRFAATHVLADAARPLADLDADAMNTLTGTLSMVAVAGPYTTSDNMSYEPLKDLLSYISTHRPHVVIMTGPFMDCEHVKVKDGNMTETYKAFYDKLIDSLAEVEQTSPHTKIYIVSSSRDAFNVNIYPTPPYPARRRPPRVAWLSDPATLSVGGVRVAVTSTDVLMMMSQEEISHNAPGDKLSRLAGHLLQQQSLFPLCPPPPALAVDAALWAAHAQLTATPHVLIVPSNFRYFVKEVAGCVVVNPERLSKGEGGGTLARLLLRPGGRVAAQIVRI